MASQLPEPMARVLGEYERHLAIERDLTPHTVRAYLGDVAGLLEHAARLGHTEVATRPAHAAQLARPAADPRSLTHHDRSARHRGPGFTAWLARTGRAAGDVGASLGSPKAHQSLPPVLRADEASDLIRAAA